MQTQSRKRNRVIRILLALVLTVSMLGELASPALAAAPETEEPDNITVQTETDTPENLETPDAAGTETTETPVPDDTEDTQDTVFLERDTNAPPTYTVANGGFETGDLTGWTLLNGEPADNNNVGVVSNETTYWNDNPEQRTRYFYQTGEYFLLGNSKEGTTGAIRSSDFTLGGDGYISFLIGGASSDAKGSVKLYQANEGGEDTLVATYTNPEWHDPKKGMTLIRKYDKLSDYIGKQLYFVVENGTDTNGFAFINADDFRTSLTLNDVKELHKSEMERIQTIDDKYKNEIIDSYKNCGLAEADYAALVSTIPETITRYAGNTVELAELIRSFTKVEMAYGRKPVDFTVRITDADYNGELTLSEGTYTVKYTLAYAGMTADKSFIIDVKPADAAPKDVENGGFETGDLTGWTVLNESVWTGSGISSDETYWNEKLPFNHEGVYYLSGWNVTGDEGSSWGVRSSLFTLSGSGWVSFRMGGNAAQVKIYQENGTLIAALNQTRFNDANFPFIGQGGSWADMGTYFVDLSDYTGQQLYVELWDRSMNGGWRVAFFDSVKCYYENVPDVANGFDTVTAPVERNANGELQYGDVKIPWTVLEVPDPILSSGSKDVLYLSFDWDSGFSAANAWGWKENAKLTSVFENPAHQAAPVQPYRPNGVRGKALNFDGYSNSLSYCEIVEGSKLTVDVYVCPRVFCWSAPQDKREDHVPEVITGSYDTANRAGFLLGVTKHGYLTFRVGTGTNWYNLVGNADSVLPTYEWSRVTAVFDGDAGKINLYLNGKPAGEMDIEAGSKIVSSGTALLVGRGSEEVIYEVSDKTLFPGLMDELTVSLETKNAAEVAAGGYALPKISYEDAMTPEDALAGDYYRPQYHAAPSGNWMNEPHALFQYNGRWHLFYQFAPAGPYWQTISWGHWVSDDMVSWEYVKEAVIPVENSVTPDAVWTGNMIFDSDGKPLLLITAGDDGRSTNGSNQHVGLVKAVNYNDPNLTDWEVIGYARAQEDGMGKIGEFRDAQAFGIGNQRYMVVGGAQAVPDGQPQQGIAHVFRTTAKTVAEWEAACKNGALNGMDWEYMGSLLGDFFENHTYSPADYGDVWEMPNLVPLQYADGTESGKYLFVFSPQHGRADVWYYIGEFDPDTCRFTPDFADARLMDYGDFVFTGPTVYLNNNDGRVYISSIMQDGRNPAEHKAAGWAHFAGLPRELYLKKDGTLGITNIDTTPVEGSEILSFENLTAAEANQRLQSVHSDRIKIEFEFNGDPAAEVGFILKKSGTDSARLYLNGTTLGLDGKSGSYQKGANVTGTIYVDKCSIEAYIDDSITISGVKYITGTGLEVFINGAATCSVTITEMNSIRGRSNDEIQTITFNVNGEKFDIEATAEFILPAPAGKKFGVWIINGVQYAVGERIPFNEDALVTAVWEDRTVTPPAPENPTENAETYYISIPAVSNGEIIPSTRYAEPGERVTLTVYPSAGYELDSGFTVTDLRGRVLSLRDLGGNRYSLIMPDSRVTVNAGFVKIIDEEDNQSNIPNTPDTPAADEPFTGLGTPGISGIVLNPAAMPFTDVPANRWFYNSVEYMWKHYLMSGVSDTQFAPNATTSRAMIWTVLARMSNVRTEVNPGSTWYERGMLWAMEQGITDGSNPMGEITREQLATMLWRSAGSPGVTADLSRFSDGNTVSSYAQSAVSWAVANGILNGSDGKLNPKGTAARAQVAAMVMRYGERIGA